MPGWTVFCREREVVARVDRAHADASRRDSARGVHADYGLSVATLAKRLGVSRQSVNEVVRERRAVSTETAMRLGRLFGASAEYWLNLQRNVDLWESLDLHREELDAIEALSA